MEYRYLKINEYLDETRFNEELVIFNNELKSFINSKKDFTHKVQTFVSYILVNELLKKNFNISLNESNLKYQEDGRPYFTNPKLENINLSVSHCHELVVVAINDGEIGIDTEKLRDLDYLKISKKMFSSEEYSELENIKDIEELQFKFFYYWCLKESLYKINKTSTTSKVFIDKDDLINSEFNYRLIKKDDYLITLIYKKENL